MAACNTTKRSYGGLGINRFPGRQQPAQREGVEMGHRDGVSFSRGMVMGIPAIKVIQLLLHHPGFEFRPQVKLSHIVSQILQNAERERKLRIRGRITRNVEVTALKDQIRRFIREAGLKLSFVFAHTN